MDEQRFDDLTRTLAGSASRRTLLKALAAGSLGGLLSLGGATRAGASGCTKAGRRCKNDDQCCSGDCDSTTKHCACAVAADCPQPGRSARQCSEAVCTAGVCGIQHKAQGSACEDGNLCTVNDVCDGEGECVAGPDKDCDDGNPCTTDTCDRHTGVCKHRKIRNCCHSLDCDDGNPCTTDSCDPNVGCVHVNNDDDCDDGDICTVGNVCAEGICTAGSPLDCDDGNVCTVDTCDSVLGCQHVNEVDGTACNAGNGDGACCTGNCCTTACTCGANSEAGNCQAPFAQNFDSDASGWEGVTASGGVGTVATDGSSFTRWGGYTSVFPVGGYTTSVDVYLDMSANPAVGTDLRFDYSSAISTPDCSHRRDFVLSAGTDPTTAGQWAISASNNTPGWPANPGRNPLFVSVSGNYIFQHTFYDNGGVLAVDLTVNGPGGNKTWTLSDPSDIIGVTVGGNRYGWFVNNAFSGLAIDNSSRA